MHAVFGTFERLGDQLHNAALLVGPSGLIGVHRKNHLPFLGGDRFVDLPPNPTPSIFDTAVGKIGIAICYEIRFPEVARTLTLGGAEIIALPTNWPMASRILAEAFTSVRAAENMVYFIASNRNDSECGVQYLGMSRIVDPIGNLVGDAETNTALIIADLDMRIAQTKKIIFESGKFEISPIKDRRPESYRM
ncbi:hypothetical protein ASD00_32150 [Ensifer sp. Root31]|nr:hypothetical protein ASD00_32150 [Ensifer sp. Root31]